MIACLCSLPEGQWEDVDWVDHPAFRSTVPRAKPVVAVVGRPNIGKSTLVNRIVGRRAAVVEEMPGVTRDRREFDADWDGTAFTIIDTGGWQVSTDNELVTDIRIQAEAAIASADLILFLVDSQASISPDDAAVADLLRAAQERVILVANKVDNETIAYDLGEFYRLGLGDPRPVSAIHGHGVADLLDLVVSTLPEMSSFEEGDELPTLAIIGRPNVGKSTLLNQLLGEDRVVVSPIPGTTRDPIDAVVDLDGTDYRLVDTAGIRRRPKVDEDVEFFAILRARQVLKEADVALLLIDAVDGVTHQDQRIAEEAAVAGTSLVIVLNKWDIADTEQREWTSDGVGDRLAFVGWAPVIRISAKTGARLKRLGPAVDMVLDTRYKRIPTGTLNRLVSDWTASHPPPVRKGRRARVMYAVQAATAPPTIILFVSGGELADDYLRYIERRLRREYDFTGTPLHVFARRRTTRTKPR